MPKGPRPCAETQRLYLAAASRERPHARRGAADRHVWATHRAVQQRLRGGAQLAGRQQCKQVSAGLVQRSAQRAFFAAERGEQCLPAGVVRGRLVGGAGGLALAHRGGGGGRRAVALCGGRLLCALGRRRLRGFDALALGVEPVAGGAELKARLRRQSLASGDTRLRVCSKRRKQHSALLRRDALALCRRASRLRTRGGGRAAIRRGRARAASWREAGCI